MTPHVLLPSHARLRRVGYRFRFRPGKYSLDFLDVLPLLRVDGCQGTEFATPLENGHVLGVVETRVVDGCAEVGEPGEFGVFV